MSDQFHLADLFERVAASAGERTALFCGETSTSYAQMDAQADALAAHLYDLGIRPGDHAGLYMMNGAEYLVSFFALVKLGAVPFNINYRYGFDELKYLLVNANACALIHGPEFSQMAHRLSGSLAKLRHLIAAGPDAGEYHSIVSAEKTPPAMVRKDDDYILQYTGGTTGHPKGVMWQHKAFFFACLGGGGIYLGQPPIEAPDDITKMVNMAPPLKVMPLAPLMHGAAIWTALSALLGGITLVLDPMREGFNATDIWDRAEASQVNIMQIVGDAMAVPLLAALEENPGRWDLKSLIHFGSGGAVFSAHIKDALSKHLPGVMMGDGMGTSETGISGMGAPPQDGGFMQLPCGPLDNVIADGQIAKDGETGLLARTGHVPLGYYGDKQKTAEIFCTIDGQRWVLSGDQAIRSADGMITIYGRGSTCINSGGEKIYPEEVETVLRAHPAISDSAVIGRPDEKWGQSVAAIISIHADAKAPSLSQIQSFCRGKLAGYKIPRALKVAGKISRSEAGKQNYSWAHKFFKETS